MPLSRRRDHLITYKLERARNQTAAISARYVDPPIIFRLQIMLTGLERGLWFWISYWKQDHCIQTLFSRMTWRLISSGKEESE